MLKVKTEGSIRKAIDLVDFMTPITNTSLGVYDGKLSDLLEFGTTVVMNNPDKPTGAPGYWWCLTFPKKGNAGETTVALQVLFPYSTTVAKFFVRTITASDETYYPWHSVDLIAV